MKVKVSRKEHFNAAHRLFRPDWSDAENEKVFGKCSNPNYHGHNYELVVSVTGEPRADTGFVFDLKVLSDLIKEDVPGINKLMDADGNITDPAINDRLAKQAAGFAKFTGIFAP